MLVLPIEQAEPGVKLAMSVYHPESPETELLKAGYVCDSSVLSRLREMGIYSLYVAYPGFEELDKFLSPHMDQSRLKIYSQIKETFAAVEHSVQPTAKFPDYYAATHDLVLTLMQQGDNALYLEQLSARLPSDEVSHATAVAHLALLLGIRLEHYLIEQRPRLSRQHASEVVNLGVAGMLHDLGKVKLPPHLRQNHQLKLPKENPDRAEWESHAQIGYDMVRYGIEASAAAAILQHHQRFDGSGFPAMKRRNLPTAPLSGSSIHVFARILAAVDLFDRLSIDRDGRRRPNIFVLHLMRTKFAGWIDPEVIDMMATVVPPFPPGQQVQLSDGSAAIVVDIDRPYQPIVRRISPRTLCPEGEPIKLRTAGNLCIASIDKLDVRTMIPPPRTSFKKSLVADSEEVFEPADANTPAQTGPASPSPHP